MIGDRIRAGNAAAVAACGVVGERRTGDDNLAVVAVGDAAAVTVGIVAGYRDIAQRRPGTGAGQVEDAAAVACQ